MHPTQKILAKEMGAELERILNYWQVFSLDKDHGGFIGERDFYNHPIEKSNKGIILNSRILWSFAAASNHLKSNRFAEICDRSFDYVYTFFRDKAFGGVFWELDFQGNQINSRKQVYAQAFMVYALSEYVKFNKNKQALNWAIDLFALIEKHAYDNTYGGYTEAFSRDWNLISDMRLSAKDANEAKTMNTHLHVLEAYTTLYQIAPTHLLKTRLEELILLFLDTFFDAETNHFQLFFDEKWQTKGEIVSYGHDIEAVWLLIEAAKVIGNEELLNRAKGLALKVASTFIAEGMDSDGGVYYEYNLRSKVLDTDKHWWPQAEAIVGLNYAYEISKKEIYLNKALKIWNFTKDHVIDPKNGEWYWSVNQQKEPNISMYKLGFWKAPYHNSRACMKMMNVPSYNSI
ncbi:AGE family epimerase/isomerase [Namhaeicola litoreus]|uniref:Cellobiose 2-epimerase n=1 Tax=Namhaeicola litoreus TaxID=1052145 RepID=A0ABW3Y0U3_9FLAO